MEHLWVPEISVWEKVLRSGVVYLFLLFAFRLTGKRQMAQLTPFDLVVVLLISNVLQNAIIGNDNSLGGGILGAATILGLNFAAAELTYRFKAARRLLEGGPTVLIHNGKVLKEQLGKEKLTLEDLEAACRKNGVRDLKKVRFAVLEENGQISVIPQ
ncbi:MAG TPA: YetF domain-containing protein [bacterium]|nr:YetF domain-containing protein [bacterium]